MKKLLNKITHKILWALTQSFPSRVRDITLDDKLYLRRFYITNRRSEFSDRQFGLYLHYFFMGDEDRELHNHPWKKSISLILAGGYDEERLNENNDVEVRAVTVGRANIIEDTAFHRIMMNKSYGEHTWSLFMSGQRNPKSVTNHQDWGFLDRETLEYVPHEQFESVKNREDSESQY